MSCPCYSDIKLPHEDEYRGYDIFIERNRDPYREDLSWQISIDNGIWDDGGEYSLDECLKSAKKAIDLRIDGLTAE